MQASAQAARAEAELRASKIECGSPAKWVAGTLRRSDMSSDDIDDARSLRHSGMSSISKGSPSPDAKARSSMFGAEA